MIEKGQIRASEDGAERVAVVIEAAGRFVLSEAPGEVTPPWEPVDIEARWPRVVGATDDPGHFKFLAALDAAFTRMGIPPEARTLPTVRARLAAMYYLACPAADAPRLELPLKITAVEAEAMWRLRDLRWGEATSARGALGIFGRIRAQLCEVLGFVEPDVPAWALPGSYVFDIRRGIRGAHQRVQRIEEGVAMLVSELDGAAETRVPVGLLYGLERANPSCPNGLPCEACGRLQRDDGCGWAPCERCRPCLHGRVTVAGRTEMHLWWCRLTLEEKGCTCAEHETKVPYWNGTREGLSAAGAEHHALVIAANARGEHLLVLGQTLTTTRGR